MLVDLPVLYSFRRCPYAIRARMAVSYSAIAVELREVVLRDMPASLLACSPKGTVPVLVLPGGAVLEESRDIIDWALANSDPDGWLQGAGDTLREQVRQLVDTCDTPFKQQLDYYKYAERYPQHSADYYRSQGQLFLGQLEQYLESCDWLCGDHMTVADVSIFPFVRQFVNVDKAWFDETPYLRLQAWLDRLLCSQLFTSVMAKYPPWREGDLPVVFPPGLSASDQTSTC
jgi:glutathione S-transferase